MQWKCKYVPLCKDNLDALIARVFLSDKWNTESSCEDLKNNQKPAGFFKKYINVFLHKQQ